MNNEGSVGPIVIIQVFSIAFACQVDAVYTTCTIGDLHFVIDGCP